MNVIKNVTKKNGSTLSGLEPNKGVSLHHYTCRCSYCTSNPQVLARPSIYSYANGRSTRVVDTEKEVTYNTTLSYFACNCKPIA